MGQASFSFQELREAGQVDIPAPETLAASDGVVLSYRCYVPASPRAALVFYHGGGAHSGAGYQYVGHGLMTDYDTAVYMPDIRGHGASGGPRGDAPYPGQVWADITSMLKHARAEHPDLPLFLGGHSSGAALALNYAGQPGRERVSGYLFLSPQLGYQAQIDRPGQATPFVTVDVPAFTTYAMSGGKVRGHDYAVKFNYPAELLASDPGLVAEITINMSASLTPSKPHDQFAALDLPFGLWIGADDELFVPEQVLAFGDLAASVREISEVGLIPGGKHLGVLVTAHETLGPWIVRSGRPAQNQHCPELV